MSVSTIFIKPPANFRSSSSKLGRPEPETASVLSAILWTLCVMYSATKVNFSPSVLSVSLSFPILDLILISLSTILLLRGFEKRSVALTLPWIILTFASTYFNHYSGLVSAVMTMVKIKKIAWLPWATLAISGILLIIRITLMVKVLQFCANIWFKNKLDTLKIRKGINN